MWLSAIGGSVASRKLAASFGSALLIEQGHVAAVLVERDFFVLDVVLLFVLLPSRSRKVTALVSFSFVVHLLCGCEWQNRRARGKSGNHTGITYCVGVGVPFVPLQRKKVLWRCVSLVYLGYDVVYVVYIVGVPESEFPGCHGGVWSGQRRGNSLILSHFSVRNGLFWWLRLNSCLEKRSFS